MDRLEFVASDLGLHGLTTRTSIHLARMDRARSDQIVHGLVVRMHGHVIGETREMSEHGVLVLRDPVGHKRLEQFVYN